MIELHSSYEPRIVIIDSFNNNLISGGSEGNIVKYNFSKGKIIKIWKALDVQVIKLDLDNGLLLHSSQSYVYLRNYSDSDIVSSFQLSPDSVGGGKIYYDDDKSFSFTYEINKKIILNGIYVFPDRKIIVGFGDKLYFWDYIKQERIAVV